VDIRTGNPDNDCCNLSGEAFILVRETISNSFNNQDYFYNRAVLSKQADHVMDRLLVEPSLKADFQVILSPKLVKYSVEIILEAFQNICKLGIAIDIRTHANV
jgi:hypothetical protein